MNPHILVVCFNNHSFFLKDFISHTVRAPLCVFVFFPLSPRPLLLISPPASSLFLHYLHFPAPPVHISILFSPGSSLKVVGGCLLLWFEATGVMEAPLGRMFYYSDFMSRSITWKHNQICAHLCVSSPHSPTPSLSLSLSPPGLCDG